MTEKELKEGDVVLVEVHGWVMCQGLPEGKYRMEIDKTKNRGYLISSFYKPKGKKLITRHYLCNIMIDDKNINANRTELIKKLN